MTEPTPRTPAPAAPQAAPQQGQPAPAAALTPEAALAAHVRGASGLTADWRLVLGGLADPAAPLPEAVRFRAQSYQQARGERPPGPARDYLSELAGDRELAPAVRTRAQELGAILVETVRQAGEDGPHFTALASAATHFAAGEDSNLPGMQLRVHYTQLSPAGKRWLNRPAEELRSDATVTDLQRILRAGVVQADGTRSPQAAEWVLAMFREGNVPDDNAVAAAAATPATAVNSLEGRLARLTPDQRRRYDELRAAIVGPAGTRRDFSDHTMESAAYSRLQAQIAAAPEAVRDALYLDPRVGTALSQQLSPEQQMLMARNLDPIEALYQRTEPMSENDAFNAVIAFLRGNPGEGGEAMRHRVQAHNRLMDRLAPALGYGRQSANYRLLMRLIATGSDQPTPRERVHEAAERGDHAAACAAVMQLAGNPAQMRVAMQDLMFRQALENLTGNIEYRGQRVRALDLALIAIGQDPSSTRDPLGVDNSFQALASEQNQPLTVEERARLNNYLFDDFIGPLYDALSGVHVNDDTVVRYLTQFQRRSAEDSCATLLRRDRMHPGVEMQRRLNARLGCRPSSMMGAIGGPTSVGQVLRNHCNDATRHQAEIILGTLVDTATVGTLHGQGALASDQQTGTEGHVPLAQALQQVTHTSGDVTVSRYLQWCAEQIRDELNTGFPRSASRGVVGDYWRRVHNAVDAARTRLVTLTGDNAIHAVELLRNAYLALPGGGSLEGQINAARMSDGDKQGLLNDMGLNADGALRRRFAGDEAGLAAARARQELFPRAQTLHNMLDSWMAGTMSSMLRGFLDDCRETPAPTEGAAPAPTLTQIYREEYGITPRRHAALVCRRVSNVADRRQMAEDLGVTAELDWHAEELRVDLGTVRNDRSEQQIRGEAEQRARAVWDEMHGGGQVARIRTLLETGSDQERALTRAAFRNLSQGVDAEFYLRNAYREARDARAALPAEVRDQAQMQQNHDVGDGMRIVGTFDSLEETAEVANMGRASLHTRLRVLFDHDQRASRMEEVYRSIESATESERRAVIADTAMIGRLRQSLPSHQFDRIYRGISGQETLNDILQSRAHGVSGWSSIFSFTDIEGMRRDLPPYVRRLRERIRSSMEREARARDANAPEPTAAAVNARVREACQAIAANPDVRAILDEELSGRDLTDIQGRVLNAGQEDNTSAIAGQGNVLDDEAAVLRQLRAMSAEERQERRRDPEFLRRLHAQFNTEEGRREAVNALMQGDSSDDHLTAIDTATRAADPTQYWNRTGNGGLQNIDEDALVDNVGQLTPEEFRRLQADPQRRALALMGLGDSWERGRRELVRQTLAYDFAEGSTAVRSVMATRGRGQNEAASPDYAASELERLGYERHQAQMRLLLSCERDWDTLLRAASAVYSKPLRPQLGEDQGGTAGEQLRAAAPEHERRIRADIWNAVQARVQSFCASQQSFSIAEGRRTGPGNLSTETMCQVIREAVLHQQDCSGVRLQANAGAFGNHDSSGFESTLREASPEQLISEWTSVRVPPPYGGATLRQKWTDFARARDALRALADDAPTRAEAQREERWRRNAFMNHVIDVSVRFEQAVLRHTGGVVGTITGTADTEAAGEGERRVRDNSAYERYRRQVLDRMPGILRSNQREVAEAIGMNASSSEDLAMLDNDARTELTRLNRANEDHENERLGNLGNRSSIMANVVEGLTGGLVRDRPEENARAWDAARGDLDREVNTALAGDNQVSGAERHRIEVANDRVEAARGEFREARERAASIAARVAAILATIAISVVSGGTATGPAMLILWGTISGASAGLAEALVREAALGRGYDFATDGVSTVVQGAWSGALTAGVQFYSTALIARMAAARTVGAGAQAVLATARQTPPGFWARAMQVGRGALHEAGEEALQTGMEGLVESAAAMADPSIFIHGFETGLQRGLGRARERLAEVPGETVRAAAVAATNFAVQQGVARARRRPGDTEAPEADGPGDAEVEAVDRAADGGEAGLRDRVGANLMATQTRGQRMVGQLGASLRSIPDSLQESVIETIFSGATWRGETSLNDFVGSLARSVQDGMRDAQLEGQRDHVQLRRRAEYAARQVMRFGTDMSPSARDSYIRMALASDAVVPSERAQARELAAAATEQPGRAREATTSATEAAVAADAQRSAAEAAIAANDLPRAEVAAEQAEAQARRAHVLLGQAQAALRTAQTAAEARNAAPEARTALDETRAAVTRAQVATEHADAAASTARRAVEGRRGPRQEGAPVDPAAARASAEAAATQLTQAQERAARQMTALETARTELAAAAADAQAPIRERMQQALAALEAERVNAQAAVDVAERARRDLAASVEAAQVAALQGTAGGDADAARRALAGVMESVEQARQRQLGIFQQVQRGREILRGTAPAPAPAAAPAPAPAQPGQIQVTREADGNVILSTPGTAPAPARPTSADTLAELDRRMDGPPGPGELRATHESDGNVVVTSGGPAPAGPVRPAQPGQLQATHQPDGNVIITSGGPAPARQPLGAVPSPPAPVEGAPTANPIPIAIPQLNTPAPAAAPAPAPTAELRQRMREMAQGFLHGNLPSLRATRARGEHQNADGLQQTITHSRDEVRDAARRAREAAARHATAQEPGARERAARDSATAATEGREAMARAREAAAQAERGAALAAERRTQLAARIGDLEAAVAHAEQGLAQSVPTERALWDRDLGQARQALTQARNRLRALESEAAEARQDADQAAATLATVTGDLRTLDAQAGETASLERSAARSEFLGHVEQQLAGMPEAFRRTVAAMLEQDSAQTRELLTLSGNEAARASEARARLERLHQRWQRGEIETVAAPAPVAAADTVATQVPNAEQRAERRADAHQQLVAEGQQILADQLRAMAPGSDRQVIRQIIDHLRFAGAHADTIYEGLALMQRPAGETPIGVVRDNDPQAPAGSFSALDRSIEVNPTAALRTVLHALANRGIDIDDPANQGNIETNRIFAMIGTLIHETTHASNSLEAESLARGNPEAYREAYIAQEVLAFANQLDFHEHMQNQLGDVYVAGDATMFADIYLPAKQAARAEYERRNPRPTDPAQLRTWQAERDSYARARAMAAIRPAVTQEYDDGRIQATYQDEQSIPRDRVQREINRLSSAGGGAPAGPVGGRRRAAESPSAPVAAPPARPAAGPTDAGYLLGQIQNDPRASESLAQQGSSMNPASVQALEGVTLGTYEGDLSSAVRLDDTGEREPVIRIGTSERVTYVVPEGVEPRILSTGFVGCGGTCIRGRLADGRTVIHVGHVAATDSRGHSARIAEDLANVRRAHPDITDLHVVVMPGNNPGATQVTRADLDALGVPVTVHARADGEANLLVTRDGVTTFDGDIGHQVAGQQTAFQETSDVGARNVPTAGDQLPQREPPAATQAIATDLVAALRAGDAGAARAAIERIDSADLRRAVDARVAEALGMSIDRAIEGLPATARGGLRGILGELAPNADDVRVLGGVVAEINQLGREIASVQRMIATWRDRPGQEVTAQGLERRLAELQARLDARHGDATRLAGAVYGISLPAGQAPDVRALAQRISGGELTASALAAALSVRTEVESRRARGADAAQQRLDELEATDHISANRIRFGLSDAEIGRNGARNQELYRGLDRATEDRVMGGDYDLGPLAPRVTTQIAGALSSRDPAAIERAMAQIPDLETRREVMRRFQEQTGRSFDSALAESGLSAEQQASLRDGLAAVRATPAQIAEVRDALAAERAATARFRELVAQAQGGTEPAGLAEAAEAVVNARQAAVRRAIEVYGIDDSQIGGRGIDVTQSNPTGDLRLNFAGGLDVFEGGFANARSPGLFAASLGHELEVHGRQLREGRMAYGAVNAGDDDVGTAVNEIEAYGYMMRESNRYGLDDEERVMVGGRMDDFTRGLLRRGQIDPADLAAAPPEIRQSFEAALPSRRGPRPGEEDPSATQAIRQILRGDFSLPQGVTPVVPGAGNDSPF